MQPMWMVRAERGRLYDEFLRHGVAALGWTALARLVAAAGSRQALLDMSQGQQLKQQLDEFMPISQIIVARKP